MPCSLFDAMHGLSGVDIVHACKRRFGHLVFESFRGIQTSGNVHMSVFFSVALKPYMYERGKDAGHLITSHSGIWQLASISVGIQRHSAMSIGAVITPRVVSWSRRREQRVHADGNEVAGEGMVGATFPRVRPQHAGGDFPGLFAYGCKPLA